VIFFLGVQLRKKTIVARFDRVSELKFVTETRLAELRPDLGALGQSLSLCTFDLIRLP
jgi:hypothetical protein